MPRSGGRVGRGRQHDHAAGLSHEAQAVGYLGANLPGRFRLGKGYGGRHVEALLDAGPELDIVGN